MCESAIIFLNVADKDEANDDSDDDDALDIGDSTLAPVATIEQIVSDIASKENATFVTMSDLELNEVLIRISILFRITFINRQ